VERKKFSARTARPKASATSYRVTERFGKIASTVDLFPQTGRTHQLRVHLSSIGCPVLGDPTYGGKQVVTLADIIIPRVMLHAKILGFVHPITQKKVSFSAPMPDDMKQIIQQIRSVLQLGVQGKKEETKL
jgi:23S rRNA pseudouridine1911/1915/1917 synthase